MQRNLILSENGRNLTARLSGEIDHHSAKKMREEIDARLFKDKPSVLVLDFSEVGFMDTSGIGLIIGRSEIADAIGARVRLVGLSGTMRKVVKLSGIEKIKNITVI